MIGKGEELLKALLLTVGFVALYALFTLANLPNTNVLEMALLLQVFCVSCGVVGLLASLLHSLRRP